jgi:hypothetical protein
MGRNMTQEQATSNSTKGADSTTGARKSPLLNKWFLACIVLLCTFTVTFEVVANFLGVNFKKEAVPLKKPLKELNKAKLEPYELLQPRNLPHSMVDQLGTEKYIQWMLKDTSADSEGDGQQLINLFVTYYTGTAGQVPHVPEECYLGAGHQKLADKVVNLEIPELGENSSIPVHLLYFQRSAMFEQQKSVVMYVFNVNGEFAATRNAVRVIIGNFMEKYGYFSKLEVSFKYDGNSQTEEEVLRTGRKFLRKVIPVLVEDHWPDWEKRAESAKASE